MRPETLIWTDQRKTSLYGLQKQKRAGKGLFVLGSIIMTKFNSSYASMYGVVWKGVGCYGLNRDGGVKDIYMVNMTWIQFREEDKYTKLFLIILFLSIKYVPEVW